MELPNYYDVLKVESSADLNTIKKAFRHEIALYHPDNNKNESAKAHFELLVEAFNVLSHPERRQAYDQMFRETNTNKPIVLEPKQEQQYKEWKQESKQKSDKFWFTDLADLLVLDLFLDVGLSSLFSGTDSLLDSLGDSLGDVFDIF